MSNFKQFYYAIVRPDSSRIVHSWPECQRLVNGVSANYKKFSTEKEAMDFIAKFRPSMIPSAIPGIKPEDAKVGPILEAILTDKKRIVCFTDGSKTKTACGYGIHFPGGEFPDVVVPLRPEDTISRAEAYAIFHAMHILQDNGHIVSDSKYCCDTLRFHAKEWINNGEFASREHNDLFGGCLMLARGKNFVIEHTRGHKGVEGNERADYLAGLATGTR